MPTLEKKLTRLDLEEIRIVRLKARRWQVTITRRGENGNSVVFDKLVKKPDPKTAVLELTRWLRKLPLH